MPEIRDMSQIAKAKYLAAALSDEVARYEKNFHDHIEAYKNNLQACMEGSSTLFELAAKSRLLAVLASICKKSAEREPGKGVTPDDLMDVVKKAWPYINAVPRSTSAGHNVAEAYMAQAVLDFTREGIGSIRWARWFEKAQQMDPEYQEWSRQESARYKAEREAEAAAEAAAAKEREAARNRVRVAVTKGKLPEACDVLLAWPKRDDAQSIRSQPLKHAVERIHDQVQQAHREQEAADNRAVGNNGEPVYEGKNA